MSYDCCDSGVLKNRMHQDILQSTNSEIQYSDHSSHETFFEYRTNGLSLSRHNLVSSCTEQEENKKPPWDRKSFKEATISEAEGDGEVVSFGIGLLLEPVLNNELYSTSMKSTCFERAQKICTTMNIIVVCIHVYVVGTNAEKNAGEVSKNISSSDMLSHGILILKQLNKELQDVVLDDAFRMEHLEDSRLFRKMMIDWDCLLKHLEANTQRLCHAVKKRCPDFRGNLHEKDNIRCASGMFVFGVLKVCDVRERTSLLDLYLLVKRIIGNTVPRDNSVTFRRVTLDKHTDLLESVLRQEGTFHLILCMFRDSDALFKDMDYLPIDWDCLLKHLEANTQKLCHAVKKRCPDFRGNLHEKDNITCASGTYLIQCSGVCDMKEIHVTSMCDLHLLRIRINDNTVPRKNLVTFRRVTVDKHSDILESVLRNEGILHLILCVFRDSDSLFKDLDYLLIDWDYLLKHLEAKTQKLYHASKIRCADFREKLKKKDNLRSASAMFAVGVLIVFDVRESTSLLDLYLLKGIVRNTVPKDNLVTFGRVTLDKHTDLLESVLSNEGTLHLIHCVFRESDSLFKDLDYLLIYLDCLLKHLEANPQKLCHAVKKRCPDFREKSHEKDNVRCASGLDHLKAELKKVCHAGEKRCPDFREKLHGKDNLRSASGSNECSENEQFMFFFALFALMLLVSTHSCCLKIDIDKPSKPSVNQSEQVKETLSFENGSEKTEILETERYGTENDSMRLSYSLDLLGGKRSRFIWVCIIEGVKEIVETKQVQNGDKSIRARKRFEGELSANVIYKECFMKPSLNIREHVKKFFDNGIGKIGMSARKLLDVFDSQGTSVEHGKDETELEELENNKGDVDAATPLEEVEDKRIEIGQRAEVIQESSSPNQDQLLNDFDSSVVSLSNSVREAQNDPQSFHSITGFDNTLQNVSNKLLEKVKGSNCRKSWRDNSNLQIPRTEIDVYHKDDCLQTVAEVEMSLKKENSKFEPVLDIIKQIADGNDPGPQVTMRYELLRICTLRNYPKDNKPFLIHFAKAGFYYAAEGDEVICYCCGLRRHSWVATDVPYRIHQRINPNCKFLNRNSEFNVPITYSGTTKNLDKLDKLLIRLEKENKSPQATTDAEGGNDLSEYVPPQALSGGLNNPKHRQYMSKTQRLSSYEGWPDNLIQTPEIMADAGFYYAGFGDCVRCYYCGIGLRHWTAEDNVWIEHARWSKHCAFLKQEKGQEFINLVHMAIKYTQDDDEQPVIAASNPDDKETPKNGESEQNLVEKILLTDPAQSVLEMGYTPKIIKKAIAFILNRDGRSGISSQTIMERVLEFEEAETARSLAGELANMDLSRQNNTSGGPDVGSSLKSNQKSKPSGGKTSKGLRENSATPGISCKDSRSKSIKEENEKLKGQTLCRVCTTNTVCIVLLPCGHLCACDECGSALRTCPMCQKDVKGTVKTYMS